jgi:glycosyltransferase involved in cell wall biosynthesis
MKIVHLSASDNIGGAAIAARRVHDYFLNKKVDSHFLTFKKRSNSKKIFEYSSPFLNLKRIIFNQLNKYLNSLDEKPLSGIRSMALNDTGIHKKINNLKPDCLILHWINGETCSINDLQKINKEIKIYWWCHDMWPFQGTYHYDLAISNNPLSKKIENYFFNKKKIFIEKSNLTFICPSEWLQKIAKKTYPNDSFFVPNIFFEKSLTKQLRKIGLSTRRKNISKQKIITFMAVGGHSDPRKGGKYLNQIIENFKHKDVVFNVIGNEGNEISNNQKLRYLGHYKNIKDIANIISESDVFINTSLADNFPNTIVESILCGTPVVSFNVGGISSIINNLNGSLVDLGDVKNFSKEINRWIENPSPASTIQKSIINMVTDNAFKKFLEIYENEK